MQFIIRADASFSIGSGHVMRCLCLAENLTKKGGSVSFICKILDGDLIQHIQQKGFQCHTIDSSIDDWKQDAIQCETIILEKYQQIDWLIVDHYGLEKKWEEVMRNCSLKILAFDDLAKQEHSVDLILNQNDHCSQKDYSTAPQNTKLLLGSKFAILRECFINNNQHFEYRQTVKRIFISFGSFDQTLSTIKVLKACINLSQIPLFKSLEIILLYGKDDNLKKLAQPFLQKLKGLTLMPFKEDIVSDLQQSDIAIGAGGTSLLERLNVGIPNLVTTTADNQTAICEKLSKENKIIYLGEAEQLTPEYIESAIHFFSVNTSLRQQLIHNTQTSVDGKGVERLCNILCSDIKLRPALENDSDLIYEWRNHPQNRSASLSSSEIPYKKHQQWLKKTLVDSQRKLFIAENVKLATGVCRLDIDGDSALVSIYLKPNLTNAGFGQLILNALVDWAKLNLKIQTLKAEIKPDNFKSIRIFENIGFKKTKIDFELVL